MGLRLTAWLPQVATAKGGANGEADISFGGWTTGCRTSEYSPSRRRTGRRLAEVR
jgi:hypothetical protein